MNRQSIRYTLWILIFFLVFILFNTWENEKTLTEKIKSDDKSNYNKINLSNDMNDYFINEELNEIMVNTNLISAKINLFGGDITFLLLFLTKSIHLKLIHMKLMLIIILQTKVIKATLEECMV